MAGALAGPRPAVSHRAGNHRDAAPPQGVVAQPVDRVRAELHGIELAHGKHILLDDRQRGLVADDIEAAIAVAIIMEIVTAQDRRRASPMSTPCQRLWWISLPMMIGAQRIDIDVPGKTAHIALHSDAK